MSINVCVYRGRTASCLTVDQIAPLQNIPQLPWAHRDTYCKGGRAPRYASCRNMPWKTHPSLTQIVPTNSRPVPLHRIWRAPGRPMPSLGVDGSCNHAAYLDPDGYCDVDMNNTPLTTDPTMNDEEYLSYNNPAEVRGADGILRISFYNGPGWKISRVHGKSKSRALPRPIKHWRKQLFPRQKLNLDSGPMYPMYPHPVTDPSLNNTNGGRQGRLSILDRPGGAITLSQDSVLQQYYAGNLNNTSCVPLYFPTSKLLTGCDRLREENECVRSLHNTRPGYNVKFNKYSFSSSKMYLQARARLHHQQATIQFNKYSNLPVLGWQGVRMKPALLPPSSVSLYLTDSSGCFTQDCSCAVPVSFKPRNAAFARDDAVRSSTNISRRRRSAITRNQYNVTNKWGMGGYDTLKKWPIQKYKNTRMPSGGTGIRNSLCCDDPELADHYIPPIPPKYPPGLIISMEYDYWLWLVAELGSEDATLPIVPNSVEIVSKWLDGPDIVLQVLYTDESGTQVAKSTGFSMRNVLNNLNGITNPYTGELFQYPLNILQWDKTPFTNDGLQFSAGMGASTASWTGAIKATDTPGIWIDTSMNSAFVGVQIPKASFGNISDWDVKNVQNIDRLFLSCTNFNSVVSGWNVSNVTSMYEAFQNCEDFNNGKNPGVSSTLNWDTSKVTAMWQMFFGCSSFNADIGNWDTSLVGTIFHMFFGCINFDQDLSRWDTSNFYDIRHSFNNCNNFNNGGISPLSWNTSNVKNMSQLFMNCHKFNADITGWDTSLLYNMESAFLNCYEFNQDLSQWNIGHVTIMTDMFTGCTPMDDVYTTNTSRTLASWFSQLHAGSSGIPTLNTDTPPGDLDPATTPTGWPGGLFDFSYVWIGGDWETFRGVCKHYDPASSASWTVSGILYGKIAAWNVSLQRDMSNAFVKSYNGVLYNQTEGNMNMNNSLFDLSKWDTANVYSMFRMFSATNFNGDISKWDVSKVTDTSNMFRVQHYFDQDISGWNVSSVTTMFAMFENAHFNNGGVDPLTWNTRSLSNTSWLFADSSFNQDIGSWNVSNVTTMFRMFATNKYYTNADQPLTWSTLSGSGKITSMEQMFSSQSLNSSSSDASTFNNGGEVLWPNADLSTVTTMYEMFYGATVFNQDISTWNVSGLTNMGGLHPGAASMFSGATKFDQNIGPWNIPNTASIVNMFKDSGVANDSNQTNNDLIYGDWNRGERPAGTFTPSQLTGAKLNTPPLPPDIVPGGVFTNNNELSRLTGCTMITSSVQITGFTEHPDFSFFDNLETIQGNLIINNNPGLLQIVAGFPKLTQTEHFDLFYNHHLGSISGFDILETVGYFHINGNPLLTTMPTFNTLVTINGTNTTGAFNFNGNPLINTLSGFEALQTVYGLAADGSAFQINSNTDLFEISGFTNLSSINGKVQIQNNKASLNVCENTYNLILAAVAPHSYVIDGDHNPCP